ncbi:hypothetical protein LTS12_028403 [Elasticomyces elasticus]|nr:hypothetical protein LTS12_028403 [Elasticomyces elasticus]
MQFTIVTILSALTATVIASPVPDVNHAVASVVFHGAADASFTETFRTTGQYTAINNQLSISKISVLGSATCTFHGVDGSVTHVSNGQTVDVGPPQTQISGSCY